MLTLTGPRQSGKTTLCRHLFTEHAYTNLEDPELRAVARSDPRGFLAQSKRLVIDEFQRVPELASYIQILVDEDPVPGRFVLTGSQQLELSQTVSQSLAGRTAVAKLLPLSLAELPGEQPSTDSILFKGGYPRLYDQNLEPSMAHSGYLQTYVERDVRQLSSIQHLSQFEAFVRLCATQVGQHLNSSRMAADIGVDQKTIRAWLSVLEASFLVFLLPPHFKNLRKRIVKAPKLYFYDTGLAAYLLGVRQEADVARLPNRGALFENLLVMEALKQRYNALQQADLFFYRDQGGHEVDLLLDHGLRVQAVEIKASQTFHPSFLKGLRYYVELNDSSVRNAVIYGGEKRLTVQGIDVVPIAQAADFFAESVRARA